MFVHELGTSIYRGGSRHVQYVYGCSDWTSTDLEWRYMHAYELSYRSANSDPNGVSDYSILSVGTKHASRIYLHGCFVSDSRWSNINR